jgi:hypothetical protein
VELGTAATLIASASDADGDALVFTWRDASGSVVGADPILTRALPLGTHAFTVSVEDGRGGAAADEVSVTVRDTTAPAVSVTAPDNVSLFAGVPSSIEWTASDNGAFAAFDVGFSADGGATFAPISGCTGLPPAARSCTWPSPGPPTTQGRVRVTARDASGNAGADDASLVLVKPTVRVTDPNTAVTWRVRERRTIRWTHNLGAGATVRIEISRDAGARWTVLAASHASSSATAGSFTWTVTGPTTTRARIRVTWTKLGTATDTSDVNFRIR